MKERPSVGFIQNAEHRGQAEVRQRSDRGQTLSEPQNAALQYQLPYIRGVTS